MIKRVVKWVAPGLVTVFGGAALAVMMTGANVAADIDTRAASAMLAQDTAWVELQVDARDVMLRGTASDQAHRDAVIAALQNLHGVRSVTADVQFAPLASPYPFTAVITDGTITLGGGVPDAATREQLLARVGADGHELELRSGMPKRADWLAGVDFAIDQLKHFDRGQVAAADLDFTMSGRARSSQDFRALLLALKNDVPPAIALNSDITPPLVAPYRWSATSDGKRIQVSGYVPDAAIAERLRTADVSGLPVATGLALASGEPQGFADNAQRLLENLSRLDYGAAYIIGGQQTLTGAPATAEIAQAVTLDLAQAGSIVTLEPPRITDYWMSATRQPGGVLVFDGYVPDEATRQRLSQIEGADINFLKLGRGAPPRYQAALDFGLSLLDHLSEGRFALRDNVITMTGIARSSADYQALADTIAAGPPQGLLLARSEVTPPAASPYLLTATKTADGSVALSGMVPSPAAKTTLAGAEGRPAVAAVTYASGEPAGFTDSAIVALQLLKWLDSGTAVYDGSDWTVSGIAGAIDKAAIEADFATRRLAAADWTLTVAATPAAPAPVSPYTWSAVRTAAGAVTLSGSVPTPALKSFLAVQAGDAVADTSTVATGAPDGFIDQSRAALDAVLALDSASAQFNGKTWSLTGAAPSPQARDAVVAQLGAIATDWTIEIAAAAPAIAQPAAPPKIKTPTPPAEPASPVAPVTPTELITPAEPVVAEPPSPPVEPAASAALAACQASVAEFSARNAILFQSGAAIIAAESEPALDELAGYLSLCPQADVEIEGYTDADGDDQLNLALSVARAEAVVTALTSRNVAPSRLYAIGYGESDPIADNDTPDGKRLNRRIVVKVLEHHVD